MLKRRKLLGIATLVVAALAVGGVYLVHTAHADDLNLTEGIDIRFDLVSQNDHTFTYRTAPFVVVEDDSGATNVLNDPEHPGELGMHEDGVLWINLPDDYTLSVYPQHVAPGVIPKMPTWWSDVAAFAAAHPGISCVDDNQRFVMLDDGQYRPMGSLMLELLPIDDNCPPARVTQPFFIEYTIILSGDLTDLEPPQSGMGVIYRVPASQG